MSRVDDLRVDWFRLLADLKRQGFSMQSMADAISIPKATLISYKQGTEPSHMTGERLVLFWCQATDMQRDQVPMISRYDWRA